MGAKTSSEYLEWESFINRDLPLLLNSQKDYFVIKLLFIDSRRCTEFSTKLSHKV